MSGKGVKRRSWSIEQKRMIVSQSREPGVSVSQVARRYDVNANLVFTWLRDPRYNTVGPPAAFLPVALAEEADFITQQNPMAPAKPQQESPSSAASRVVITVAGGHQVEISGAFDGTAVAQLLKGLAP